MSKDNITYNLLALALTILLKCLLLLLTDFFRLTGFSLIMHTLTPFENVALGFILPYPHSIRFLLTHTLTPCETTIGLSSNVALGFILPYPHSIRFFLKVLLSILEKCLLIIFKFSKNVPLVIISPFNTYHKQCSHINLTTQKIHVLINIII